MVVKANDGKADTRVKYNVVAGMISSMLEGSIFDQLFPEDTERGISAIKLVALALQSGIKVYGIDASNVESIVPKLQVHETVISEVRNAVNAGSIVIMPEATMAHAGWSGESYIALDAQGNGAYMLSSGDAGGRIALSIAAAFPPLDPPALKDLQCSFRTWLEKKGISYAKLIKACPLGVCGSGDTACNDIPLTKQAPLDVARILNFLLGLIAPNAEAFCIVDDLTFATIVGLSVLLVVLFKMGADIYENGKSRSADYPEGNICSNEFIWCLENVWQPDWNVPQYGPRKDCPSCFSRCVNEGAWPQEMCPNEL
jgi:hypothetical protein